MCKKVIIFLICLLCILQTFSYPTTESDKSDGKLRFKYAMYLDNDSYKEICSSTLLTANNSNVPVMELQIDSILSSDSTEKSFKDLEHKEPVDFIVKKSHPNDVINWKSIPGFKIISTSARGFFFIASSILEIVVYYYLIKIILCLVVCIVKDIEREKHMKILILNIYCALLACMFVSFLSFPFTYCFHQLIEFFSIEEYVVNLNSNISKLCFKPEQLVQILPEKIAEIKAADIPHQTDDFVKQTLETILIVKEWSIIPLFMREIFSVLFHVVWCIFLLILGCYIIKILSDYCQGIEEKFFLENPQKEKLTSKPDLKDDTTPKV